MVQVGSSVDHEHDGEGEQEPSWTGLIRDAVKDFVDAIGDSTRQLALAAERFASDSLNLIDDATLKARESAESSSDMAAAARTAAEDARTAAEALQTAVIEAGDKVRAETRATIDEALAEVREAQAASEQAKADMLLQADEILRRIEHSNEGGQEVVRAAQAATEEVRQAAQRVTESAGSIDTAVNAAQKASEEAQGAAARAEYASSEMSSTISSTIEGARQHADEARSISQRLELTASDVTAAASAAQRAAEEAESTARRIEASVSAAAAAVEAGQRAAEEARQAAETVGLSSSESSAAAREAQQAAEQARQLAEQATSVPGLGSSADTLLERLEDDYQMLTTLVQELANRVTTISSAAAAQVEPDAPFEPVTETPVVEAQAYNAPSWTPVATPSSEPPVSEPAAESEPEGPIWTPQLVGSEEESAAVEEEPETATWVAPSWSAEEQLTEPSTPAAYAAPAESPGEPAYSPPVWESEPEPVAEAEPEAPFWRDVPAAEAESALDSWMAAEAGELAAEQPSEAPVSEEQTPPESTPWTPQPVSSYEAAEPEAAPAWSASLSESTPDSEIEEPVAVEEEPATPAAATSDATLFGRVQVNIAPVPDFDRLLSLDSALSHVGSVQSVTLADYAHEEVTFRIDLASPLAAVDFAQQLSDASGLATEIEDADGSAVTLRIA